MADTSRISTRSRTKKRNAEAGDATISDFSCADDSLSTDPSQQGSEFTQLKDKSTCKPPLPQGHALERSMLSDLLMLAAVFAASLLALGLVYASFPKLEEDEVKIIKLPHNLDDAKNLGKLLHRLKDKFYFEVFFAYFVVYVFLQTFAIPGSIFLSIISGFLFPFWIALPLVCSSAAIGASFCYLLSLMFGVRIVQRYFPERAAEWKIKVDNHRENLFNYILFLRITPFLPNWFINITSPVINVPLIPFFVATFLGVAPPSFMYIQLGTMLNELTSTSQAWSWSNMALLTAFAGVSMLPVLMKKRLREKME